MSSSVRKTPDDRPDMGIDASLLKPVKAAELLSVIKAVVGKDFVSKTRSNHRALKTANPSRVLVAEDSSVNQELIKRLLEKWGHRPEIAEDGRMALSLFNTNQFDLILMDLQMPEVNGFEVTAKIREAEHGTDRHIPIVALTAHALTGDRERCVDAGMDDYVSKPIDAQKLFEVVEIAAARAKRANGNGKPHVESLDLESLVKSFDGDRELVTLMARVFADSSVSQLSSMRDAVARGDAEELARGAHTIRGSVVNFRANAAIDAAAELEHLALAGNLSSADAALSVLEEEIERLREGLQSFEQVNVL